MFFLSSCLVSSFGPGLQNKNGSHNTADIEAIAISHEESLNFHAAAGLYFVAKGGLESFPDTQKAGLIRFAIRNILRDVTLAPMTANGDGPPLLSASITKEWSLCQQLERQPNPHQIVSSNQHGNTRIAAAEDSFRQIFLLKQRRRTGNFLSDVIQKTGT